MFTEERKMNRRTAVRNLLAASAGSVFTRLLVGNPRDDHPQEDPGIYKLHSEVRLVLLDVSVKDSRGGFVSGLSKANFNVLENGRLQSITVFDRGDVPVTVGILVDESRSMTPKRSEVLTAAETFIEEGNRQDEVFILNFNDRVVPGLPSNMLFSDDIQQLSSALHRGVPEGKTALNDAVVAGLKQLELGKRDKKTLVIISDGGDNASEHNRRDTLEMVESSIATIYTIGLFEADDPDRDPGILRQLAKISGGEAYFPDSPSARVPVCRRIAREIRTRYTIGYLPLAGLPSANIGAGSLRHVNVRVSAPGHGRLVVRTPRRDRDGQRIPVREGGRDHKRHGRLAGPHSYRECVRSQHCRPASGASVYRAERSDRPHYDSVAALECHRS
jgi:VWFA-related protein